MCHRCELWHIHYINATSVDSNLVSLVLTALEPIDGNSFAFRDLQRMVHVDNQDSDSGTCFWDICNGTRNRALQMDNLFDSGLEDENGTFSPPMVYLTPDNVAWVNDCCFGCSLRSHLDKKARLELCLRAYAKYDALVKTRLYCPDSGCEAIVDATRRQIYREENLFFATSFPRERHFTRLHFSPIEE